MSDKIFLNFGRQVREKLVIVFELIFSLIRLNFIRIKFSHLLPGGEGDNVSTLIKKPADQAMLDQPARLPDDNLAGKDGVADDATLRH